jgi:hypothetical protein
VRTRSLTTALTVLCAASAVAVAVPAALASPPPGHGASAHAKPSTAGHGHVKVRAQLVGRVTSVGDAQLGVHVTGGNRLHHGKDVTVLTTDKTIIRYHGHTIELARVPVGAKVTAKVALFSDGSIFAIWINVNGATQLVPSPSASATPAAPQTPVESPSTSDSPSPSTSASASAS